MTRAIAFALAPLLLCALVLNAGEESGLEYARGLLNRRFYDLAREEFERISGDRSRSTEDRAEGEFGLGLVEAARARDAAGEKPPRLEEAAAAYDAAIERFERVSGKTETWLGARARFRGAVARYRRALLNPPGSTELRRSMQEALDRFDGFAWEAEETILGGYAFLYYGLAKKALDDPDGAFELLKAAAAYAIPDPVEEPEGYRVWTELVLRAYVEIGALGNELGRAGREVAIPALREMRERIPGALLFREGHLAQLELARALAAEGEHEEALELATEVSRKGEELATVTAWGAAATHLANRLLTEILARFGDTSRPPEVLERAARAQLAARRWALALRAYRNVIQVARTIEDVKRYAAPAWMKIGLCYYMQDKFLEAYVSYEYVASTFEGDLAGEGAYWRYRSAAAHHAATKDPRDRELARAARREFIARFPGHRRAADLRYYEGVDLIADGDYRRALERLREVKPSSPLYARARTRMGEAHHRLGEHREALEVMAGLDLGLAVYFSALCHLELGEFESALRSLADFAERFPGENIRSFYPHAAYHRVRALLLLDRLDDAEQEALAVRELYPDFVLTPRAFRLLGLAFYRVAQEAKALKEEPAWRKALGRAADHLAFSIKHLTPPSLNDLTAIGTWYHQLGDWEQAAEFLEQARRQKSTEPLLRMLATSYLALWEFDDARRVFEELLVPDAKTLKRVLDLLCKQGHSRASLQELRGRIRANPKLLEGLARAYRGLGGENDLLRALTLTGILVRDRERQYTKRWWRWQLLRCEPRASINGWISTNPCYSVLYNWQEGLDCSVFGLRSSVISHSRPHPPLGRHSARNAVSPI